MLENIVIYKTTKSQIKKKTSRTEQKYFILDYSMYSIDLFRVIEFMQIWVLKNLESLVLELTERTIPPGCTKYYEIYYM